MKLASQLFPSGMGIAALCVSLLSLILLLVFRKKGRKSAKNSFLILTIISFSYLLIGICVFFRPPYISHGDAYFPSGIKPESVRSYLDDMDSTQALLDALLPHAEIYSADTIKREDGSALYREMMTWQTENHGIQIVKYVYDNPAQAKSDYEIETASERRSMPDQFLKASSGYFSIADSNGWDFCVFPIKYDGSKFLLPYADSSGASFSMYAYYGNSYVRISESTHNGGLFLPSSAFRTFVTS